MLIDIGFKKIKICDMVIKTMYLHRQIHSFSNEVGGIIIGRESIDGSVLVIEYLTEPMPNDKSDRNEFIRRDEGHIEYFERLYRDSNHSYAYVGEWHTHPEMLPDFSSKDFENWVEIGEEMCDYRDEQYHFIVGRDAFVIWRYSHNDSKFEKLGDFEWNGVVVDE